MADNFSTMVNSVVKDEPPTSMPGGMPKMETPEEYTKKGEALLKKEQDERKPLVEAQEASIKKMFDLAGRLKSAEAPAAPTLKDMEPAPQSQYRDPTQALGSMGSVLALIGSFKTRRPMTAALNAAAASMKGFHQGDQERVKLEREKWHDNMEAALKQNQIETERYTAALQRAKFDIEKARPEFEAIAAESGHNQMLMAAQHQDYQTMEKIYEGARKTGDKMVETYVKDQEFRLRQKEMKERADEARQDRKERAAQAATAHHDAQKIVVMGPDGPAVMDKNKLPEIKPGEKNLTKFGASASPSAGASDMSNPENSKFWAEKYFADKSVPAFAWGASGNKDRQLWREAIVAEGKRRGMSGIDAAAQQAIFKADSSSLAATTKDLNMLEPYKKMLDINGEVAIKLGKEIIRTDSALANKSLNWLKTNVGDHPDTAEYLFQINTLQTEAARVLNNPRLVGQLSDQSRQDMQEVLSGAMPIAASERVIRRMQQDGTYRIDQMREQVAQIKGNLHQGQGDAAPSAPNVGTNPSVTWTPDDEARLKELEARSGAK